MPEADRREALYLEARAELLRQIRRDGLADLSDHERRTAVARCLSSLCERWPELDGQLSRRLLAEALDAGGAGLAPRDMAPQPSRGPSSGHANVTTLRRDERPWVR